MITRFTLNKHQMNFTSSPSSQSIQYLRKNNGILKFAGKLMDLENIILSGVTQMQKDKYHMYSHISDF